MVAVGVGATEVSAVGATEVSTVGSGVGLSTGWACGAMIVSVTVDVATGEVPGAGVARGLSRCIWSNHFITVNPTTRTMMPMISGMNELRPPPLLTGALRRRTFAGRIGSGSGASCK